LGPELVTFKARPSSAAELDGWCGWEQSKPHELQAAEAFVVFIDTQLILAQSTQVHLQSAFHVAAL
jgi:hypothetical protein